MSRKAAADLVRARARARPRRIRAEPTPVVIDAARSALVVIDMQNDFCAPGGWFDCRGISLEAARGVIPAINRTVAGVRRTGIPVIWLNWGNRPDRLNLPHGVLRTGKPGPGVAGYGERPRGGRGPVLERGSWGARIVRELDARKGDIYVDKHRLSGFWDNELDSILRRLDVTTLLFAGVNLDRCVLATMQDAAFIGYDPILIDDCSATASPQYCADAARYLIRLLYGFVTRSSDLLAGLGQAPRRRRA